MPVRKLRIADCHCDTIALFGEEGYDFTSRNRSSHLDLPRLIEGRIALQFFAVCTAPLPERRPLHAALRMIGRFHRTLDACPSLQLIETQEDLLAAEEGDRIGALLALEGAEPLEGSVELLDIFCRLGLRALSLTWNHRNPFADGVGETAAAAGLTRAGRKLVEALSRKGIILDLAHLAPRSFAEALELTSRPPLVSHANARALCEHRRNLDDEQLKALAARNGVIGLTLYPHFIAGREEATLDELVDHFVHIAELIGVEHLACGSDFDGIGETVTGIADAAAYPNLLEALQRRGFRPREIELIARGNVERILRAHLRARVGEPR